MRFATELAIPKGMTAMAIVTKKTRNGVRFLVRVRDQCGRWYPGETFRNRREAVIREIEMLSLRERGSSGRTSTTHQLKVDEFWSRWSCERRHSVSEGWRLSQNQMYRDHVFPHVGERYLRDIRPHEIGAVVAAALDRGLSPQTASHVYALMHRMFDDAVNYYDFLDRNPVLRRDKPKVPRIERRFLSPQESVQLLEASRGHYLGRAIWISLLAGLRPSEVQALRYDALDFGGSRIVIREAYKKKVRRIEPYPKQKSWGSAPMPPALSQYLSELGPLPASAFVAPGLRGGMLQYEKLLKGLKVICSQAGVQPISPHELRHSATELYVDAGASAEDIRRLLNQTCLSSTQRYMHRTEARLSAIAKRVLLPDATGSVH